MTYYHLDKCTTSKAIIINDNNAFVAIIAFVNVVSRMPLQVQKVAICLSHEIDIYCQMMLFANVHGKCIASFFSRVRWQRRQNDCLFVRIANININIYSGLGIVCMNGCGCRRQRRQRTNERCSNLYFVSLSGFHSHSLIVCVCVYLFQFAFGMKGKMQSCIAGAYGISAI